LHIAPDVAGSLDSYAPSGHPTDDKGAQNMPKYLIERNVPGAGNLTPAELHTISVKSNSVLADMAPRVQWVEGFATTEKVYCVYIAEDADAVQEHADCAGLPADLISQVSTIIGPVTGE